MPRAMMDPAAARLADDHYRLALSLARRNWPDGDENRSDVGLALCVIAQRWVDEGRHLQDGYPFEAWLTVKLPWSLVDLWRRREGRSTSSARRVAHRTRSLDGVALAGGELLAGLVGALDPALGRVEERAAAEAEVGRLFGRLTRAQRRVVTMLAQGMTATEVGERLGVSVSAVCHLQAAAGRRCAA